jgi:hypothetical protein
MPNYVYERKDVRTLYNFDNEILLCGKVYNFNSITHSLTHSVALVRKRTIPTERPQLVGEVSASFCG